jgi:hypothetical protein
MAMAAQAGLWVWREGMTRWKTILWRMWRTLRRDVRWSLTTMLKTTMYSDGVGSDAAFGVAR